MGWPPAALHRRRRNAAHRCLAIDLAAARSGRDADPAVIFLLRNILIKTVSGILARRAEEEEGDRGGWRAGEPCPKVAPGVSPELDRPMRARPGGVMALS